jgi:hypothetical protein
MLITGFDHVNKFTDPERVMGKVAVGVVVPPPPELPLPPPELPGGVGIPPPPPLELPLPFPLFELGQASVVCEIVEFAVSTPAEFLALAVKV